MAPLLVLVPVLLPVLELVLELALELALELVLGLGPELELVLEPDHHRPQAMAL